jgi:hypothetical protein
MKVVCGNDCADICQQLLLQYELEGNKVFERELLKKH